MEARREQNHKASVGVMVPELLASAKAVRLSVCQSRRNVPPNASFV